MMSIKTGDMRLKGYLWIAMAAALWGVIGPVSRLAFREGMMPLEAAFWRALLAWGLFGVHALLHHQIRIQVRDLPAVCLFGLTGVSLFYGSYLLAIEKGGAALAAVLLYTAPAWVALMSRIFFKEMLTPGKLAALILCLAGVAGVSMGAAGNGLEPAPVLNWPALCFGLTAGFCYSLYYIFGKYFSGRYQAPTLFFYLLPIGAAGLFPWIQFSSKTATAWGALMFIAFFSTYGAYYCYYIGLKTLEATRAATTATLEPVVAGLTAYVWWGEVLTPMGYAGSLFILAGVLLMVWEGTRSERRVAD